MGSQKQRSLIRCPFLPGAQPACFTQKAKCCCSGIHDPMCLTTATSCPCSFIQKSLLSHSSVPGPVLGPRGAELGTYWSLHLQVQLLSRPQYCSPSSSNFPSISVPQHGLSFLPRMPFLLLCLPNPYFSFNNLSVRFFTYSIKQSKSVSTLVVL